MSLALDEELGAWIVDNGTASSLERQLECPASAVLAVNVQESGVYAERGDEIHIFCRSVIAGTPRHLALAAVTNPRWRETCEQIDFRILTGGLLDVRAEVAYRLNYETDEVIELGMNLGRRYPPGKRSCHIDGTNDYEGFDMTRRPVVTDIKTGYQLVTRCQWNPQIMFHARCLQLKYDVPEVEGRIAYVDEGGEIRFDRHTFTVLELDSYNDRLIARRGRIEHANRKLRETGHVEVHADEKWCRYCPAKVVCPRFTALSRSMLGDMRKIHEGWSAMSAEERAAVFLQAVEARDLAEMIIGSQRELAKTSPIALPGGKELRDTGAGVRVVKAERSPRRRRTA